MRFSARYGGKRAKAHFKGGLVHMIWNFFKSNPGGAREISPDEALVLGRDKNCIFIDVREADETANGAIDGAKHLPLSQLGRGGALPTLPDDARIVLYCATSMRAKQAARMFEQQGFDNLYILKGGYNAWNKAVKAA